ncbi:hypothetical protein GBAR_LOCUS12508 [Geodia barretti]|uniref:Uncharacterized protein n=1 Tax=Geodia barretti TaxID=519541 RepID=A0AA35WP04_GEOBA|nr:hypothetical protein GBAR_LOCUS12508 [Geodia barretti]
MIENFMIILNLFPLVGLVMGFIAIVIGLCVCCIFCCRPPGHRIVNGRWQPVPWVGRAHETRSAAVLRTSSVSTARRETSFNTSAYGVGGGRGSSVVMYSVAEPQPPTYTHTTSFPPIQRAPPTAPPTHMPQYESSSWQPPYPPTVQSATYDSAPPPYTSSSALPPLPTGDRAPNDVIVPLQTDQSLPSAPGLGTQEDIPPPYSSVMSAPVDSTVM